jgi:uncharacterized membrane protein YoaK (UPF0700 family)
VFKIRPSILLSLNGGYVDTLGFLSLQGLFTAHVTGNFVTLAAALVLGASGVLSKLLALPVFCFVVVLVRLASRSLPERGRLRVLIGVKIVLLLAAAAFAVLWGPYRKSDAWQAVLLGMTLVSAMAIQNAAHRLNLSSEPPTTLMTGNTTQVMIDLVDRMTGRADAAASARFWRMAAGVGAFATGCALAAAGFAFLHMYGFLVPPLVALAAFSASAEKAA